MMLRLEQNWEKPKRPGPGRTHCGHESRDLGSTEPTGSTNHNSQPLSPGPHSRVPSYQGLRRNTSGRAGGPQSPVPLRTTVVNTHTETALPDHAVWSA